MVPTGTLHSHGSRQCSVHYLELGFYVVKHKTTPQQLRYAEFSCCCCCVVASRLAHKRGLGCLDLLAHPRHVVVVAIAVPHSSASESTIALFPCIPLFVVFLIAFVIVIAIVCSLYPGTTQFKRFEFK
jgi:hypothetical protein